MSSERGVLFDCVLAVRFSRFVTHLTRRRYLFAFISKLNPNLKDLTTNIFFARSNNRVASHREDNSRDVFWQLAIWRKSFFKSFFGSLWIWLKAVTQKTPARHKQIEFWICYNLRLLSHDFYWFLLIDNRFYILSIELFFVS